MKSSQHYIGIMQGCLALRYRSLWVILRLALMMFNKINAFHNYTILCRKNFKNLTGTALVLPSNDDDLISSLDALAHS